MPSRWPLVLVALLGCSTPSTPAADTEAEPTGKTDPPKQDESATRCKADDDCRLSCIRVDDCCPGPELHRCNEARHWDDHAKVEATRSNCAGFDYGTCSAKDFSVEGMVQMPVCTRGRCEVKQVEREPPPGPIDLSGFDRSCKADTDCALVESQPCAKCGCASDPIAASELQRAQEAVAAVKCPAYDPWPDIDCGSCMPPTVVCVAGQCTTTP